MAAASRRYMQSMASKIGEANFVEIFNEATHNNHQFGGYPNGQYALYLRYGIGEVVYKWSDDTISTAHGVVRNMDCGANIEWLIDWHSDYMYTVAQQRREEISDELARYWKGSDEVNIEWLEGYVFNECEVDDDE